MGIPSAIAAPGAARPSEWALPVTSKLEGYHFLCKKWHENAWKASLLESYEPFLMHPLFTCSGSPPDICPQRALVQPSHHHTPSYMRRPTALPLSSDVPTSSAWPGPHPGSWLLRPPSAFPKWTVLVISVHLNRDGLRVFCGWVWPRLNVLHPVELRFWMKPMKSGKVGMSNTHKSISVVGTA